MSSSRTLLTFVDLTVSNAVLVVTRTPWNWQMRKSVDAIASAETLSGSQTSSSAVTLLLERLRSPDAQAGWEEFLRQYSSLLYHSARTFTYNQDEASDCFVHICQQLVRLPKRMVCPSTSGSLLQWRKRSVLSRRRLSSLRSERTRHLGWD